MSKILTAVVGMGVLAAAACASGGGASMDSGAPNTLSAAERAQGWRLLFDGQDLSQWRGFKRQDAPASWRPDGDAIAFTPSPDRATRGDLMTREQFGDFELAYEWKISEGGNSGVIYRATEAETTPWRTGPEMQVLDDARHPDAKQGVGGNRTAGALYDMIAPSAPARPAGEWNQARIVARGNHIEHWLNGQKVVDVDVGSARWNQLFQASKFKELTGFGVQPRGHIVLQDHNDPVWYRNVKIRPIG